MYQPQYIYISTNENYDTHFIGNDVTNYNCFMFIHDDINGNEDDDYYDPDAYTAFSVTDKISFIFESSFYISEYYSLFHIEISDYLYNY